MTSSVEDPSATLERLRADYRTLLQRLEDNDRQFRQLARSVFRVQEDERRRIARELHDGIGQNLTALKHQLGMLQAGLAHAPPAAHERLQAGIDLCAQTLADTRELSRLLRPQVLDDLGLAAALRWLARSLGEGAGLEVEVEVEDLPPLADRGLDEERRTLFFRVAQEALGNCVRHAGARHVRLGLVRRSGATVLTVTDDGGGFDVDAAFARGSAGASSGLGGMRERLMLLRGWLRIESGAGGTRVQATLPDPGDGV